MQCRNQFVRYAHLVVVLMVLPNFLSDKVGLPNAVMAHRNIRCSLDSNKFKFCEMRTIPPKGAQEIDEPAATCMLGDVASAVD